MTQPTNSKQLTRSLFQEKNTKTIVAGDYLYTDMVSHKGVVISFAMDSNRKISYAVLDLEGKSQKPEDEELRDIDKNFWSPEAELVFPKELSQSGFGVVKNYQMPSRDKEGALLTEEDDKSPNSFFSSTAKLSALAPFQVLSDGKYIYLFRQALPGDNQQIDRAGLKGYEVPIVNRTLLVDRFVLSGISLSLSREIRYQRSQHKTQPASRKDSLSPMNMDKVPFYEPTREIAFVNNLSENGGGFCVLQIPTPETEVKRWQIFYYNTSDEKVHSMSIKTASDGWFDPTDSKDFMDDFSIKGYQVKTGMSSVFYYQKETDPKSGKPMKTTPLVAHDKDLHFHNLRMDCPLYSDLQQH